MEESKQPVSVSMTKAECGTQFQLECEDMHEFTQVSDHVWEDHKAPNSKGDTNESYQRMVYMTAKMIK